MSLCGEASDANPMSEMKCGRTFGTGKEKDLGDLQRVLEGRVCPGREGLGHSLQCGGVLFDGRRGSSGGEFGVELGSVCELRESASWFRMHGSRETHRLRRQTCAIRDGRREAFRKVGCRPCRARRMSATPRRAGQGGGGWPRLCATVDARKMLKRRVLRRTQRPRGRTRSQLEREVGKQEEAGQAERRLTFGLPFILLQPVLSCPKRAVRNEEACQAHRALLVEGRRGGWQGLVDFPLGLVDKAGDAVGQFFGQAAERGVS